MLLRHDVHHYHHHCDMPEPQWAKDLRAFVETSLQGMQTTMTKLSDSIANLTAKDAALSGEVDKLIASFDSDNQATIDALKAQLTQAGVDDDTAAAAVDTVIAAQDATVAKIEAVLSPPPPAS